MAEGDIDWAQVKADIESMTLDELLRLQRDIGGAAGAAAASRAWRA